MIQVALASNRNYFCGLLTTITSLLESNKVNVFCIHVIDGGLSSRQKRVLATRTARHGRENTLYFHAISGDSFKGFAGDYGNSYMTYARILVGSFVQTERVIYLDTDLLVGADLRPFWEVELGDWIVAAARDREIERVRDDYPFEGPGGESMYFNAGVMVINLNIWRRLGVQEKLLQMIREAPEKFRWWDQTAMNVLFQGRVKFVDDSWNMFADSLDLNDRGKWKVLHYVGRTKPWSRYLNSPEFGVWREFYGRHVGRRAALFLDLKFAMSFLQYLRHRALCESEALKRIAVSFLKLRAFFCDSDSGHNVESFLKRHVRANLTGEGDNGRHMGDVERYVCERWSL